MGGGGASRLKAYAGWHFRVYVRVRLSAGDPPLVDRWTDLPGASASSDMVTKSRALPSAAVHAADSYRVLVCDMGRYY